MAKVSEVITTLQKLKDENGDCEMTIYDCFDKRTVSVYDDQIYFDDKKKDIYIGIYA